MSREEGETGVTGMSGCWFEKRSSGLLIKVGRWC